VTRSELAGWCLLTVGGSYALYTSWPQTRLIRWRPPGFVSKELQDPEGFPRRYVLYVPPENDCAARVPLIVFLHDIGAIGSDGREQLKLGLAPVIYGRDCGQHSFPCFALFPQARRRWCTEARDCDAVIEMVQKTIREQHVDAERVYLTGSGNGADALWELAVRYPRRWAGLVPISSALPRLETVARVRATVRWYYSTSDDLDAMQTIVARLTTAGASTTLIAFNDVGDDAWTRVYSDPDLYKWIDAHSAVSQTQSKGHSVGTAAAGPAGR
jgi:poly(3-hydroxybutyrate) depolymerase